IAPHPITPTFTRAILSLLLTNRVNRKGAKDAKEIEGDIREAIRRRNEGSTHAFYLLSRFASFVPSWCKIPFPSLRLCGSHGFFPFGCAGGEGREVGEQVVQGGVAAVAVEQQLVTLLRGVGEESRADLRAETALRDEIVQGLGHREALTQLAFERARSAFPDIEPGHVRDQEGAEE